MVMATKDFVSWKMVGRLLTVLAPLGALLAFFWFWQGSQDDETEANGRAVQRVEASYEEHVKHSIECFQKIDRTLTAQQTLIAETRETMSAVKATQEAIKAENGRLTRSIERLAEEVRRGNGGGS